MVAIGDDGLAAHGFSAAFALPRWDEVGGLEFLCLSQGLILLLCPFNWAAATWQMAQMVTWISAQWTVSVLRCKLIGPVVNHACRKAGYCHAGRY
jgi:hypothetical protein